MRWNSSKLILSNTYHDFHHNINTCRHTFMSGNLLSSFFSLYELCSTTAWLSLTVVILTIKTLNVRFWYKCSVLGCILFYFSFIVFYVTFWYQTPTISLHFTVLLPFITVFNNKKQNVLTKHLTVSITKVRGSEERNAGRSVKGAAA